MYREFKDASNEFRFAATVASWSLLLRDSDYKGTSNYKDIENWAKNAMGLNNDGSRNEFIELVQKSKKPDK
ncbi:MAG: DUF3520 domain-containing protein [Bacteroidia bacterium]